MNTGQNRTERDNNHGTARVVTLDPLCSGRAQLGYGHDGNRMGQGTPLSRGHVICEWFFADASCGKELLHPEEFKHDGHEGHDGIINSL